MAKKAKAKFRVGKGCGEDWDAMPRGRRGGTRRCERCAHDVLDLTRVTRTEAERAVAAARDADDNGRVCIRVLRGPDGDPLFAPEPTRPMRAGVRSLVLAAALGAGAASGCGRLEAGTASASEPAAILSPLGPPVMPQPQPQLPPPPATPPMVTVTTIPAEPAPIVSTQTSRRKHRAPPVLVGPPPQPPMPYYEDMGVMVE